MNFLLPLALATGVVYAVYSQRKVPAPTSTCSTLTAQERAAVDHVLITDSAQLLSNGAANGMNPQLVVSNLHTMANVTEQRGCADDARKLRQKADLVARTPPPQASAPQLPAPIASSAAQPALPAYPGALVAEAPFSPPVGQVTPGAYGAPTLHANAPGTTSELERAFGISNGLDTSAFSPAPAPPTSAAATLFTRARVAMRPLNAPGETFTVPAGFPVAVVAAGPPACPPGVARVVVRHPDHGDVECATEAANLGPTPPPPQAAAPAQPAHAVKANGANGARTMGMAQSFQGRTRRKPKARKPSRGGGASAT